MGKVIWAYDRLVLGLAALAAASLGVATLLVIHDVVSRNAGLTPLRAASALVEYALLFSTMAAAPWLVRINGHVSLSSVAVLLPVGLRLLIGRVILIAAITATAILAVVSWQLATRGLASGGVDMRSVNMPGWTLFAMMGGGFGLMATEFLRMLMRGEVYTGASGEH